MKCKVSDLIAEFLESKGIRHVFGIVGPGNAHIFDSITRRGYTEIVCVHHEQAATMAIQTYFRTCGVVTAAILTTGGGSTNGVTGVVSAWMDSVPCLVISGNENSIHTREDNPRRIYGVQGYDSVAMVNKVTKFATRVMKPEAVVGELEKAYEIACTGRFGPCWVDIPMDVQSAAIDTSASARQDVQLASALVSSVGGGIVQLDSEPSPEMESLFADLRRASRPLLWLGHGIRLAGAQDLLPRLLSTLSIPALVSWSGIDMIDSNHDLLFGRAGVYGQRCANFVLQNCDFLLAIGTRLAIPQIGYDVQEFAREARIAVVDIDAHELAKHRERWSHAICVDARVFLEQLLRAAEERRFARQDAWIAQCNTYRDRFPWVSTEHPDREGFINSYPFMEKLIPHLKPDQVIVTDMGTALLSGHQVLRIRPPQRLMTSLGLGEMGYGIPGAIGASFARGRGEVLCLNCDGGMMMNLQELQTIVHHRLPIKTIVFNNDGYLMIKHTQRAVFEGRYAGTNRASGVSCPDFSALATAFGMPSFSVRTWEDFDQAIPALQDCAGPAICEVFMHPEQPLVPKLSLAATADGKLVSPPLEDLSPLLPREELARNMLVAIHPKSNSLQGASSVKEWAG